MRAIFQDLEDEHNENNGMQILDIRSLNTLLKSFKSRNPFSFMLIGDNDFTLTVGWGSETGCVQYGSSDGRPPYFVAIGDESAPPEGYVEFLAGGTPTPIPQRSCMPIEKLRQVIVDFLQTGGRSPNIEWEEI